MVFPKPMLNEPYAEQYVFEKLSYYKKNNINPANYMKVIPVPFSINGAKMLQHTKSLLEDPDNLIVIDKRFDKLLTSYTRFFQVIFATFDQRAVASHLINKEECLFIRLRQFVNCLRIKFHQSYSPCFVADQSRNNP